MYTIVSDGVVLAPFQKTDGRWGWYAVEFLMDSRETMNEEEVLVSIESDTEEELIVPFDEELDEMNDKMQDLSEEEGW